MHIREAKAGDAAAIARVHVESWQSTYRGIVSDRYLDSLSIEERTRRWESILSTAEAATFAFLAEDETGDVVGFASGGPERTGNAVYTGELYAIYVLVSQQGKGAGRLLTRAVMGRLGALGHRRVLVWVLTSNPSRQFYAALGAKPVRLQQIEIGGATLDEVAYGWDDAAALLER